jgi:hypothetical protein
VSPPGAVPVVGEPFHVDVVAGGEPVDTEPEFGGVPDHPVAEPHRRGRRGLESRRVGALEHSREHWRQHRPARLDVGRQFVLDRLPDRLKEGAELGTNTSVWNGGRPVGEIE